MLTPQHIHGYQRRAINHAVTNPKSALWMDPGLGKTVVAETVVAHLQKHKAIRAALVIGPLRVVQSVWHTEASKWTHTNHLRFSLIHGTQAERTRALFRPADIYLINYENLSWLSQILDHYFISRQWLLPFDYLIMDESSKLKNPETLRLQSLIPLLPSFPYLTALTGTPASNGLEDLFGQFLMIDNGKRLGVDKSIYLNSYFKPHPQNGYKYQVTETGKHFIYNRISDATLDMKAKDYLNMPDLIVNDIYVDFLPKHRKQYERLEKELFIELDNGVSLEVMTASAKTLKCLQFSNGAIYTDTETKEWHPVHEAKLDALDDIMEESGGQPVLVAYGFRPDAYRILKRFPYARNITDMSRQEFAQALSDWQQGKIRMLIGHPACVASNTQVLTESRGWVRIVDVQDEERVFDGVDYVNHNGCSYSGYREVVNLFGITMTPNHKILVNDQWVEAQNVEDSKDSRAKALFRWNETTYGRTGEMFKMWNFPRDASTKRHQTQSTEQKILQPMCSSQIPQHDKHPNLPNLGRNETTSQRHTGSELWRTRNNPLPLLGIVRNVLQRHAKRIRKKFNNRTYQCKQRVLQGKLYVGHLVRSTKQQAKQSYSFLSREEYTFSRIVPSFGVQQNDVVDAFKSRNVRRRSSHRCAELTVRKEETKEKMPVYDLVNCGPRNRFLIRNSKGEMFISHNSMGHGIDGLQQTGHTAVWFGLNWSLELYLQFNARLYRQGQGQPVICHRLLTQNTWDEVVRLSLEYKGDTQDGLRQAVDEYRKQKEGRRAA